MSTHNICFRREIRKLSILFNTEKYLAWRNICFYVEMRQNLSDYPFCLELWKQLLKGLYL